MSQVWSILSEYYPHISNYFHPYYIYMYQVLTQPFKEYLWKFIVENTCLEIHLNGQLQSHPSLITLQDPLATMTMNPTNQFLILLGGSVVNYVVHIDIHLLTLGY